MSIYAILTLKTSKNLIYATKNFNPSISFKSLLIQKPNSNQKAAKLILKQEITTESSI